MKLNPEQLVKLDNVALGMHHLATALAMACQETYVRGGWGVENCCCEGVETCLVT